jgi:hypothetical protein
MNRHRQQQQQAFVNLLLTPLMQLILFASTYWEQDEWEIRSLTRTGSGNEERNDFY